MNDYIHISNLRMYGFTGVLPEEQALGQWYEVDLWIWTDTAKAAQTDELDDTYDYVNAVNEVRELVRTARYNLIERLAGAIAQIILTSPKVHQVHVRLTKVSPPIPDFSGKVSVEITRSAAGISTTETASHNQDIPAKEVSSAKAEQHIPSKCDGP
ncbi:MAG: dihydroneopterin aldolase [Kaiparowitsia implicata GSE-PSE-MK54-09C]|jgi:dihydroneopterin aldolase|nr:dihydroneopterin aldolase [Kaiparowitsia implicata GSE-PSE-MK54-09C]